MKDLLISLAGTTPLLLPIIAYVAGWKLTLEAVLAVLSFLGGWMSDDPNDP